MFCEKLLGAEQQIVEVECAGGLQRVLIAAISGRGEMLLVGLGRGGRLLGANRGRFPASDEVEQVARPEKALGHFDFAQGGSGHALLIAAIVDGEVLRITQPPNVAAEDADAERMERRDFRPLRESLSQQHGRPLLHLVGGLVGKGDGQNPLRPDAVADQLGNAVSDDAGLSRARPGQHQQRPGERVDGVILGGVQIHQSTFVGWDKRSAVPPRHFP